VDWFDRERNERYLIEPLAIWRCVPERGMMARECLELDEGYGQRTGRYEAPGGILQENVLNGRPHEDLEESACLSFSTG
jgi:hypothetical protein